MRGDRTDAALAVLGVAVILACIAINVWGWFR